MLKKSREEKKITCPQCKVVHELPPEGIDGFTTFFTINNLLELLHIHENASAETPVESIKCSSGLDENPAIARCLTCSDYLCKSCCTIHRKLKMTKAHVVKTLDEIKQSDKKSGVKSLHKKQHCEEHKDELLKIYCKTCKKVICLLCAVVTHKNHDYVVISAVRSELQKQLEKQISEIQAKEIEFQNHQKYTENLLRISNEAAKSSEKEVNKVFNEMSAALEARRAQLLAEVHSINESEVKQITTESESVACSLARLSGSIQFTKQLLDNGDDVEVAAVSDQTIQTLSSLTKMTWDKRMLQPSLLRPKFKSIEESISAFGKVVSVVEPCDIIFSDMPVDALVGKESKCEVHLSDEISERGYEAIPKVTVSHSDSSILKSTAVKKKDFNSWVVSFTPGKPGEYKIEVQIGCSMSLSQSFAVNEPVVTEAKHVLLGKSYAPPSVDKPIIVGAAIAPVASIEDFGVARPVSVPRRGTLLSSRLPLDPSHDTDTMGYVSPPPAESYITAAKPSLTTYSSVSGSDYKLYCGRDQRTKKK